MEQIWKFSMRGAESSKWVDMWQAIGIACNLITEYINAHPRVMVQHCTVVFSYVYIVRKIKIKS